MLDKILKLTNDNHAFLIGAIALPAICLLMAIPASGQTGEDYVLTWSTIDGGGGESSGGPYVLTGTIGQPDSAYSYGGSYEVLGGFWPGGPLYFVDFEDFARFAQYWLEIGLDLPADLI